MKILWLATALFLTVSTATAQEQTCDTQIQTANAMMEELQQQTRVMSVRAAQHYGRVQVLLVKLNEAKDIISKLKLKRETKN